MDCRDIDSYTAIPTDTQTLQRLRAIISDSSCSAQNHRLNISTNQMLQYTSFCQVVVISDVAGRDLKYGLKRARLAEFENGIVGVGRDGVAPCQRSIQDIAWRR